MKAFRLSPVILIAIVVLVVVLASCEKAQAQTSNSAFTFPPIGTLQRVTDYAVRSINGIALFTWTYDTNNQQHPYSASSWQGSSANPLTNKFQLDQQIIAPELTNMLYSICTNTDPTIDKSRGVLIDVGCIMIAGGNLSYDNFSAFQTNQLVNNSDRSYGVPDLSSFSTTLADSISFYVPNLQWARIEVGYKGESYPFEVNDELYDPEINPIDDGGFLEISQDYITDSSTSSGDLWIKITVFDGTFQIFNGDGNQIPETPMILGMTRSGTNTIVAVNGGDSGRGFVLQSQTNLTRNTQNNCGPVAFISPTNGIPTLFIIATTNNRSFFQTATTNLPPTN